ncbi:MAG: phosphatase PAP2 family protein [Candidatus Binatia bacterium]
MDLAGHFGHGPIPVLIGLSVLGWGLVRGNRTSIRAGVAIFLSIAISGILAWALKDFIQLPRPRRDTAGFPSGHASVSFSLAAVLGTAFPSWSPWFYLLATVTCISRLYFRAHFLRDVIAGALLGFVIGKFVSKKLAAFVPDRPRPSRIASWAPSVAIILLPLIFFAVLEQKIGAHKISEAQAAISPSFLTLDLEKVLGEAGLPTGSAAGEFGLGGVLPGSGYPMAASVSVSLPEAQNYRFFIRLFAFQEDGPACREIGIAVNGHNVTRLYLEKGWHWYEFKPAGSLLRQGRNDIQFHYDRQLRNSSKEKRMSLAFDRLLVVREDESHREENFASRQ